MPSKPNRRNLTLETARFAIVGAINFVLTFVVFFVMVRILQVHHLVSLTVAWLVGMVFSYVLNYTWVFKPEEMLRFKERFWKYFLASAVSIALNLLALQLLVETTRQDPFLIQCALIPIIVVFNYSTAKFWSLRRRNHRSP